jgi:hypothetical protein
MNYIDEMVVSRILEFADDMKLYGVIATQQDMKILQNDLKNLCNWSADWLILFNVDIYIWSCILDIITLKEHMK